MKQPTCPNLSPESLLQSADQSRQNVHPQQNHLRHKNKQKQHNMRKLPDKVHQNPSECRVEKVSDQMQQEISTGAVDMNAMQRIMGNRAKR